MRMQTYDDDDDDDDTVAPPDSTPASRATRASGTLSPAILG